MEIFLIRHAIAVERTSIQEDAARPLSPRGIRRFVSEVHGLQRLDVHFDHIFHSPWLRAVQTAELLNPISAGALEATNLLADDPDEELIELARAFPKTARIAFVGHAPWMAEFLSLLIIGSTRHADNMPFKKGGVAWLSGPAKPGQMTLRALFSPRSLRRLGDVPSLDIVTD